MKYVIFRQIEIVVHCLKKKNKNCWTLILYFFPKRGKKEASEFVLHLREGLHKQICAAAIPCVQSSVMNERNEFI